MSEDYIKLKEKDLKRLHQDLLPILLELDRICKKHNIRYFLSSGTLLGAVRHKGFIPWDDDIDVEMMREDYNKFCKICKLELSHDKFFLQNQSNYKNYNWVYGKLRLKNTEYIRSGQEHLRQKTGIFIDIFPLDKVKDNKFSQYLIATVCGLSRTMLWSCVGKKNSKTLYQRLKYSVLSIIPRSFAINLYKSFSQFYNNTDTDYRASYNMKLPDRKCFIYKNKWYEDVLYIEFEGYKLPIPIGYKDILKMYYGDYMKLPPKDKQKGNSDASYIKFSDGYELRVNK